MMKSVKTVAGALTLAAALGAQAAPVVNLFELGVRQGRAAQYDEVGRRNITTSINTEQGTLAMYSMKRQDNPNMAYMFEIYADEQAYQTHIQSAQYKAFLQASPTILTDHKKRISLEPQFLADKAVKQTPETINNLVIVEVKPKWNQKFRDVVVPEMKQSMKVEEGVLAMYALTEKDKPNRWYFYEIYASEQAYQQHRKTPHFLDYLKQTGKMLQDKQSVEITPSLLMNKGGLFFEK